MSWKIWKKKEDSEGASMKKPEKMSGPKEMPSAVGRYLVVNMGKDPDWIFCQPCGGTAVTLAMDMHRLDVQAKGTKLCASISFMDEVMIEILGEAAENWYYSTVFSDPHTEADLPGMRDIFDSAKQYRDVEPKDMAGHYMKGCYKGHRSQVGVNYSRILDARMLVSRTGSSSVQWNDK